MEQLFLKNKELLSPKVNHIVLKVSHHGSITGTSQAFLSKFPKDAQKEAFISVGKKNRYHHPNAVCGFLLNGYNFEVEASTRSHLKYKKY